MFASPWMSAQPDRRPAERRRAWILSTSILLHGAALATLSGLQAWQVQPVAEPPIADVFEVQLPLPALPAEPRHERQADSPRPRAATPAAPVPVAPPVAPLAQPDPRALPERVPPPAVDPQPADVPAPSNADRSSSSTDGNGNGKGDAPDGRGHGNLDDGPLPLGGAISRPQIVPGTKVQPRYTELARQARLQGAVVLQATIDERGNVIDVHVKKSLRFGLDEEAVNAVSQWKFTPALLHGRPVKVYFDLTVQFEVR